MALGNHGLDPVQAKPGKILGHGCDKLWPTATRIEIVVAQQEMTSAACARACAVQKF